MPMPEIQMTALQKISEAQAFCMLENRALLVTANQRLSRYLTRRYHRQQKEAGSMVWKTPDILPYSAWLGRVYDQARYPAGGNFENDFSVLLNHLLSAGQERFLWEAIIRDSAAGKDLLQISEAAGEAAQAWEICRQWQIPASELRLAPPEETTVFLGWANAFEDFCGRRNWQDRAGLGNAVIRLLRAKRVAVPEQTVLAGFDDLSPVQISLIKTLEELGCRVFELAAPDGSASVERCELPDTISEIRAAAQWARDCLGRQPTARIGIVVPAINAMRPHLIRIFDDVLHPSGKIFPTSGKKRAYNISLGLSLSQYPVIRTALRLLDFAGRDLRWQEYSLLLGSPFLGGADTELGRRAMLDARVRENGETELSVAAMIYFSGAHPGKEHHPGVFCPELNRYLSAFKTAVDALPPKQLPSGWSSSFTRLLKSAGWPGSRSLSSDETQTLFAWNETLREFAALDRVCGGPDLRMDLRAALALLSRQARERIFQPETGEASVQIMGMLEAAGERFDFMWIMGMDADSWPPPPRPNPFLPVGVQKKYNVPHASPERELVYARQVIRRLAHSADQVMVSSPEKDGDAMRIPSPLIAGLAKRPSAPDPPRWWACFPVTAAFETIIDSCGPPPEAGSGMSGGTGLLKAQAACPFSAFARYRLHAKPIETPVSGLNARDRGSLIHNVLERFWEHIQSHAALTACSDADLTKAVSNAVDQAVSAMAAQHPRRFSARFTKLEKERLVLLAKEFLDADRARPNFSVISREEKLACTIAGLALTTYADRIDRLADGRLVIVDYKTGTPKVADWFTDRIAEPQLPLYSIAVDQAVAAVVFGQVRKGEAKYLGVAAEEAAVPGAAWPGAKKSPMENFGDFSAVIRFWKEKIEWLAREIREGAAMVSPVSRNTSCRYCDLSPVCRIGEIAFL